MRYDTVIFDLDGTLIDTADDIAASMASAMASQGLPVPSRKAVVAAVGGGVGKLIERLVGEPAKRSAVLSGFMEHYGAHLLDHTRLYPGVAETLDALAGVAMAIVTNKPLSFSRRILEGLGIARYFRVVYGGDSLPVHKPDPAAVRQVLRELGGTRALFVGDSGIDVQTAKNAGIPCCAVMYGYHKPGELDGAAFRIRRFSDLLGVMRLE
ncbi:MAG: HAD-IA family hydrolase [Planctomycetes bacterium]|nr:HAD-IA family hydrolase [Planctomycetota bacterium]